MGDSIALGETCSGCATYPEQLASAMGEKLAAKVEVDNLAVPGAEVADLGELARSDPATRDAIANADAVVVTVGHNDLAYNRLDDPCEVAADYPRVEWGSITHACVDRATAEYRRDLDGLLDMVDELRGGQATMLRVTTVYNSVIGDEVDPTWSSPTAIEPSTYAVHRMAKAQCEVAEQHDGVCADTYHALNGKDGGESAQSFLNPPDATHLAQSGQDAFAAVLIELGFSPL
jgi:lysophospholipase L1-like esterase